MVGTGIRRSARASISESRPTPSSATPITISSASSAYAASAAPSRIRCGARVSSTLSFQLAGSPSVALTTTTAARSCRSQDSSTARSLRANGNPAPPLPLSCMPSASRSSCAGSIGPIGPCTSSCATQVEPAVLGEAGGEPRLAHTGDRWHGGTHHLASPRSPAQYAPSTASALALRRLADRPSPAARRARRDARSTRVGVSSTGGGTSSGTYRAGGRQ